MKVVIRVDASLQIGTGHVMRCLTLAEALKQQGADVTFICREHKGNLLERIEQQGFKAYRLPESADNINHEGQNNSPEREIPYGRQWLGSTQQQDAEQCQLILEKIKPDWLIVDHYAIDHTWQALLKKSYKKLMVIDDLADRKHICDVLLDQTYGRNKENYTRLVPKCCQMLLGSQYALLRPEFAQWRDYSLKRRAKPELKKILVTMGGVDPDNVTGQVLNALKNCKLPQGLEITVVMGQTAPNITAVQKQAKEMPYKTQMKINVNNMAELMANADLAIGAAGATTWERCCLGVPTLQVVLAENQKFIAKELIAIYAIKVLQNIKEIVTNLECLVVNAYKFSLVSSSLTDGLGGNRVVACLTNFIKEDSLLILNAASSGDGKFLYSLQTKESRQFFRNKSVPTFKEHMDWFDKIIQSKTTQIFSLQFENTKVGMIRVDDIDKQVVEISLIISPSFSGQGIAKNALRILEKILLGKILKAVIHRDNIISQRVFKALGFEAVEQDVIFIEYFKYA